ncbi:uncharacterized protein PAC_08844 [Phialocephala subalpina]|uniref:Heterokaryon incompatibility domain-containing protein n=1 Tax=Phialocephala subalpina TaxID=576137 RepID=A0A1L7X1S0_9HELO|nr:uncharacterized protein PAC_08844 [Phialocephala subalpina]
MDHLLRPQDCIDLGIELRYLCDDTDFVDLAAFPTRHGMTLNSQGRLSIEELHQHRRLREAHFLQAWLFFGTLKECFGNDFHLDDYIATLETSQHKLVHTRGLGEMLTRKDNHLLRLKGTDAEAEKQERDRLHNLILHVAQCCAELDRWHDPENFDPEWAIVLLSVKLLIQSLDLDARLDRQLHKPHHVDDPSFALLRTAMLKQRGWCSHHVQELGSANTYHALFYLASLRRYLGQWIDHSFCEATDQCTAYNVNELTHRVLHVEQGCDCASIKAPTTNMDIINSGSIPFVQCDRKKGFTPEISHGIVRPGTKYVAISHIWSDGLGNLLANELPQCQLDRILDRVEALNAKHRSSLLPQSLQQKYQSVREIVFGPPTTRVNFWVDVFCNPVVPHNSDPAYKEHIKNVLAMGISRLMPTYIFAEYVLILDHEVQQATLSQGQTELQSRLAVSDWRSRCWTHQEYCFSRLPLYQCSDGLGSLIKMDEATDFKGGSMQESVCRELQNLSPTALQSTTGIQDPLSQVLGLGYTSKSPEDLENQRQLRFLCVWNDLSRKNITHNDDSLEILANLLELRAGDLLDLLPKDQMKAVLGSHKKLPMDLLFSSTKRYQDVEEDQWIPRFPKGGEPLREQSLQVQLTPSGLLIPSRYFDHGQSAQQGCTLIAVEVLNTRGQNWTLNIPNARNDADKKMWVSLQNTNKEDPLSVPDESDIILILDTSFSGVETITRRGQPGCCLVVKERGSLEQNKTQTSYICQVLWGRGTSGREYQSTGTEDGKMLGADSPDVLIVSDVAIWKKVEARRDLFMPKSFGSRAKMTLILAFHIVAAHILGILGILNPIRWVGDLNWCTISIIVLEIAIYRTSQWVAEVCVRRANDYLQLQSFQSDWTADEAVLRRLGKALSKLDNENLPWQSRFMVMLLKLLVWVEGVISSSR